MIKFYTDYINESITSLTEEKEDGILSEELADKLISRAKNRLKEYIEKETYIIQHAKELSEDFSIPDDKFQFYPICKYSKCMNIPDNIRPDWLEGINKINEIREKLLKENPKLDPYYKEK